MTKTVFALGLGLALAASSALAAEPQQVTVSLTSASPMSQGMAMVLANQMQEQGAQVDILLCDTAGDMALKNATGEALKPNNVTPVQLLDAAIKKGATASVCALYLPNNGKTADDLRAGITPAKPADMAARLLEPQRKVMGF